MSSTKGTILEIIVAGEIIHQEGDHSTFERGMDYGHIIHLACLRTLTEL